MSGTSPKPLLSISPGSSFRRLIVTLLLCLGVVCWLSFGTSVDRLPIEVASVILLALLIPPIRRWTALVLDGIRQPSPRSANWTAVGVAIGAALLLYAFAAGQ